MNQPEIETVIRNILGDPHKEHLRVSFTPSRADAVHVYVQEDDQSILVRFTDFQSIATALGIVPSAIRTKVVTTHEWSEAEHTVKPHYDIAMSICGVPCTV